MVCRFQIAHLSIDENNVRFVLFQEIYQFCQQYLWRPRTDFTLLVKIYLVLECAGYKKIRLAGFSCKRDDMACRCGLFHGRSVPEPLFKLGATRALLTITRIFSPRGFRPGWRRLMISGRRRLNQGLYRSRDFHRESRRRYCQFAPEKLPVAMNRLQRQLIRVCGRVFRIITAKSDSRWFSAWQSLMLIRKSLR